MGDFLSIAIIVKLNLRKGGQIIMKMKLQLVLAVLLMAGTMIGTTNCVIVQTPPSN